MVVAYTADGDGVFRVAGAEGLRVAGQVRVGVREQQDPVAGLQVQRTVETTARRLMHSSDDTTTERSYSICHPFNY